jgi:inosose dehydratase
MDGTLIGCGQITWRGMAKEQALAEIAEAGYEGSPANNRNNETPAETIELFGSFGLKPAPGYLGAQYWVKDETEAILQNATKLATFMHDVGCTEMYVAANLTPERRLVAGHVKVSDALSAAGFQQMADTLNRVGEIALKVGVKASFHNHVGSFVETRQEIDKLFSLVDRSLVFQGPDLGHLAWAGDDVVAFCKDYADSITTLHIKDIDPNIRQKGAAQGWDYATCSDKGIFIELGEGFVDYPSVFDVLKKADFGGWVIVETDVTQKSSALQSAKISREYLRGLGL